MSIERASKKLSWLLRHGALEAGLPMDAAGWAAVSDVLRLTGLSRPELEAVVATNDKQRLQMEGDRIRCSQGHSLEGMPVTLEALEASWSAVVRREPLFHGTRVDLVRTILAEGLRPMGRTHVHLAESPDSKVGKRAAVAVLLEVDPARVDGLFVSPNGVWLTRYVPGGAITGFRPMTKRARQAEPELRPLFTERSAT